MAATYNTIPTLNGALWSGNAQLATKRYVDSNFSTINYELTHISSQTIVNASTIDTFSISSLFGDFGVTLTSSLQFNPSLGGVNVDLGMGGFLGGLLGGAGAGLFNTALGGAALATGIAALTMPRQNNATSPNINSNVFETINGTSQLQISTLGTATWTTQRLVSSIQPNRVPGREIFVSTLIPAGRTCIRTFSDPLYLASPSSLTSSIQAYGQWADLLDPFEQDFTASNIKITYQNQPGLWLSTTNTATSNFVTPWNGQPPVAPYVLAERLDNYISTTQRYVSTPFTYTKVSTFGAINVTPAIMDSNFGNRSFLTLSPGAPSGFVNANAYPNGPGALIDVDTTGTGQMGFYFRGTAPPTTPDVIIPPNRKQRISDWSWNGVTFEYSIGPTPLAQSTIVNTLGRLQTSVLQNTSTTYYSTNGTFCFDNQLKVYGNSNTPGLLVSTFGSSSNYYSNAYQEGDIDPTTYFKAAEFQMTTSTIQQYGTAGPPAYQSVFYFPQSANNYPYSGNVPNFQAVIPANSNQPMGILTQGNPNETCFIDATQIPVFNGIMDFELQGTAGCAIYVKGLLANGLPAFRDILVPGDSRMRITNWNWNGVFFTYTMIPTPDFVPTTRQLINRNTLSLLQNNAFNYFSTNAPGGFIFDQGITTSNITASNMNVLNFTTSNLIVSTTIVNQEFVNTIVNNTMTIDSNLVVGSPNDLGTSTQTIGITAGAFTNPGAPVPPYIPGQIVPAKIYCSTIGQWWSQDTSWTIETYPNYPGGIQMTINGGQTYTQDTYGNTTLAGSLGCAPSTSIGGVIMSNAYVWSPLGFIANNMPMNPYGPVSPTSNATNFCLPLPYNGVDSNGNWIPTTFTIVNQGNPQVVVQSGRYYSIGNPINFSQIYGSNGVPYSQARAVQLRFYGPGSVNGVPNVGFPFAYSGGGGGNAYFYVFKRSLSYETRPNDNPYLWALGQTSSWGSGPQTMYWPNTDTPLAYQGLGTPPGGSSALPQVNEVMVYPQQNPIVYFGAAWYDFGGGQIGFNQSQTTIYCDLLALW